MDVNTLDAIKAICTVIGSLGGLFIFLYFFLK